MSHFKILLATLPFIIPLASYYPSQNYAVVAYFSILNLLLVFIALSTKGITGRIIKIILWVSCLSCWLSIVISGGMLSIGAFHSILDSNIDEVTGYFSLINWPYISVALMIFLLGSYFFFNVHLHLALLQRSVLLLTSAIILLALPSYRYSVDPAFAKAIDEDPLNLLYIINDMPSYNLYRVASNAFRERNLSQRSYGSDLPLHISQLPIENPEHEDIVVIIGESSKRDTYSIYGAEINATPKMLLRSQSDPHFTVVERVFSPAPNTRESVARSLSFATSNTLLHAGLPFQSLLSVMEHAGYETVWITTQALYSRWDTFNAMIANSASKVINQSLNAQPWTDKNAIETAITELKKPQRSFIIVHIWGEHSDYRIRNGITIPKESVNAIKKQLTSNSERNDTEISYLSSVHHTDAILDLIFNYINSTKASDTGIYFPDHGEVIGKGHGLIPIDIMAELSIPFVIQGEMGAKFSAEIDRFRDASLQVFNTAYFPEVMINALGGFAQRSNEIDLLRFFSIQGRPSIVEKVDYE